MAVVWLLILRLFSSENLEVILPALLLESFLITTFYFIAGLFLLEKTEGVLEALVVTPLRTGEYLSSKLIALTFLAPAEGFVVVVASYGFGFNIGLFIVGAVLLSFFYTLAGFFVIARYDSITEFLLPSGLYTILFNLPWIDYFELWPHWIWYLIPTQAPLLLMKAAFRPVESWQLIYGFVYSLVAVGLAYLWAHQAFHRFVVGREGSSRA
jgi:fluoroquinolone transport system permease protein